MTEILNTEIRKRSSIDEDGAGNADLNKNTLGYSLMSEFTDHVIQVDIGSGTSWSLQVRGPGGVFFTLASSLADNQICSVTRHSTVIGTNIYPAGPFEAIRVVFAGAGGDGVAYIDSHRSSR
jgi:hypothetical protein